MTSQNLESSTTSVFLRFQDEMNAVREIERINQRELELGVADKGSWHDQYRDSAYVFIGGLPFDLTEGDVITVFSQFGEVMDINMPRNKETGKVRGFAFLMYEDQRSTVLAVDNMNGCQILGRTIRVDHCQKYKQRGTKNEEGEYVEPEEPTYNAMPPTIEGSDDSESSESEVNDSLDEEDPMAVFLRAEKKKEKAKAKALTDGKDKKRKHEGESKEERRARKEAKKARKAAKEVKRSGKDIARSGSGLREKDRDRDRSRNSRKDDDRSERRDRDYPSRISENDRRRDGRDGKSSRHAVRDDSDTRIDDKPPSRTGRGDREDDMREGRWELERDAKRVRARDDEALDRNGSRDRHNGDWSRRGDRKAAPRRDRYDDNERDRTRYDDRDRGDDRLRDDRRSEHYDRPAERDRSDRS
ncbi:hypothetical protein BD324DRAFT_611810 [Kockovaella imperatae]|uniref:RRM domain-containing protein n=1 Tax=Kockovaella imperatae TaxID=4999 RepID=A0A1Y1UU26_9TREE|nr:hypothetical protein BD324DRAFT_611810 [Kockovaella imperatae]ORX40695.1 hypothetical protein BD324DRAFT_611810 [Kockovaella imperatae]